MNLKKLSVASLVHRNCDWKFVLSCFENLLARLPKGSEKTVRDDIRLRYFSQSYLTLTLFICFTRTALQHHPPPPSVPPPCPRYSR